MALRLRRGTDAERLLITPVEGELIYTTDTKLLYAGDGTTAGGTLVTGAGGGSATLDALTDTDLSGTENGDVLAFNSGTNKWEPALVPGVGTFALNDISDVFINTNTLSTGDFLRRDGAGNFTNSPLSEYFAENMNWAINVIGVDSTVLVDSDNSVLRGALIGDVTGDVTGDVLAIDSSVMVDSSAKTFTGTLIGAVTGNAAGNHTGTFEGDVSGSVFGDDSTLLVDGINGEFVGNVNNTTITTKNIASGPITVSGIGRFGNKAGIEIISDGNADDGFSLFDITASKDGDVGSAINITRSRGTPAAPTALQDEDEIMGINYFGYDSDNAEAVAAVIQVAVDGTVGSGAVPGSILLATANAAGTPTAALLVDSNQATNFQGAATLKSYADNTARDAAITSPVAGMMIYNATGTKFQGYNGSAWVDLN
jgi:hypothetical protein